MDSRPTCISGDDAAHYDAVSLSSFHTVNRGVLVSADTATGEVVWKDKAGDTATVTLGGGAFRIVRKSR